MNANREFALIVLDVDSEFWDARMAERHPHIPGNFRKLLPLFRSIAIAVIHICIPAPKVECGYSQKSR